MFFFIITHKLSFSNPRLIMKTLDFKGQCGDNQKQDLCEFKKVQGCFIDVSAGWDFSLAINENGEAFGCGSNYFGQLGLGDRVKNVCEFTKLDIPEKVIKVSAGMRHSLFLLADGTLKVCGSGKKGQLCDLEKSNQEFPKNVKFDKKAIGVKTGQNFSLVEFDDGSFKAFGDDKYNQVTKINEFCDYSQVKQIELGWSHAVILFKCGQLKAFGRNDYGQTSCTLASENVKISQISSGYEHCLAQSDNQELYSWGWNEHGNCGIGHTDNVLTPTKVIFEKNAVVKCVAGSGHSFALVRN